MDGLRASGAPARPASDATSATAGPPGTPLPGVIPPADKAPAGVPPAVPLQPPTGMSLPRLLLGVAAAPLGAGDATLGVHSAANACLSRQPLESWRSSVPAPTALQPGAAGSAEVSAHASAVQVAHHRNDVTMMLSLIFMKLVKKT